jgi:hypothetical protein
LALGHLKMIQAASAPDRLQPSEISGAIERLFRTPADLARALKMARAHSKGLRRMEPLELLHEASVALLSGTRVWPRNVTILAVLSEVMWSIASNELKKKDYRLAEDIGTRHADDSGERESILDAAVSLDADPSQTAEAESALTAVECAVADDTDLALLVEAWASDLRGKDAADALGWKAKTYEAARKRLSRRLAPLATDWRTP